MRLEADTPELEPPSVGRDVPRFTVAGTRGLADRIRGPAAGLFAPLRRTRITGPAVVGAALAIVLMATYGLMRCDGTAAFTPIWPGGSLELAARTFGPALFGPALFGPVTGVLVYVASGSVLGRPLLR